MKTGILVVDDEASVRSMLREALEDEGFEVFEASDRSSVFGCLALHEIRLITLDLMLGDEDGLKLALEIRAKRNVPIVMITGRGKAIDRVVGLEHGADDYIVKPFHPREAIIRIRNVLKRYGVEDGAATLGKTTVKRATASKTASSTRPGASCELSRARP